MDLFADANSDDEIQGGDSHEDLEDEDDAPVQDQLHSSGLEKALGTV
jgi:hypothetical protein